ncbi:MAG: protein kinase [Gracilimonas sp.]
MKPDNIDINRPAAYLEGKTLDSGWKIEEKITNESSELGKNFSISYVAIKNNEKAILKALDFSIAMKAEDPTQEIIELSEAYEFEKALHELCKSQKLDKVVNILESGKISPFEGSIIPAPYFILEFADTNVKNVTNLNSRLNLAWLLRILHNTTVGLWQLHKKKIAHTHLSASSVLEFDKNLYKITDLGRSDIRGADNPYIKKFGPSNDPAHLTPEFLYDFQEKDWIFRSQAKDAYLLGNLVFFLFTQTDFTAWLQFYLDENHKWYNWDGTYEDVLPYLIVAYDTAIFHFEAYIEDDHIKEELVNILRYLCHPNPKRRGHPKNISSHGSSLSVERFFTKFERLAKLAEQKALNGNS